jgi:hypothetical protein
MKVKKVNIDAPNSSVSKKKHKASQKAEEVISSQAFHVRKDLARYIDVCPHYHASSLVCTLFFFILRVHSLVL